MKRQILLTVFIFAFACVLNAQVEKIKTIKINENVGKTVSQTQAVSAKTQAVKSTQSTTSTTATYDFTTSANKYYGGTAACKFVGMNGSDSVFAMIAGDANASGSVNTTDYLIIKPDVGNTGYYEADVNMSGSVNTTDYLIVKPNVGKVSQVP